MSNRRVSNLIRLYETTSGRGKRRKSVHAADVLRAAMVFAHATLEDFIRSICAYFLPQADGSVLDDIPLVGLTSAGRPEKFLLGRLAAHRGKPVDELIRISVRTYLDRSTFNSTQDIPAAIKRCGLDVWTIEKLFPRLDQLTKRRHQIVHRADKSRKSGAGKQHAESLSPVDVKIWLGAVRDVFRGLWGNVLVRQKELHSQSSV